MSEESKYIPPARKPKRAKLTTVSPETQAPPTLPEDLAAKWGACEATATAFNVLQKGHFEFAYMKAVGASLGFLQTLHGQTVEDALSHPDAHLIPELKAELEKRAGKENDPMGS